MKTQLQYTHCKRLALAEIRRLKMFHKVSYAYPSSTVANALGEKNGCWSYYVLPASMGRRTEKWYAKNAIAFATKEDAFTFAVKAGTQPDRFSADHPLCVSPPDFGAMKVDRAAS